VLFHTLRFAFFFLVVFPAFLLTPDSARWAILLGASVVFFGALGVPALMVALAAVTLATYVVGLVLARARTIRATWLWAGIAFNVLVLAAFKLLPASWFGRSSGAGLLATVGVSYFTFQGISYIVDVYAGAQQPEPHLGYFALYMAFFPKLLQGPIERPGDFLPQLRRPYQFDADAWRASAILFAWGLFKKTVVADRAGPLVEAVYGSVTSYQGPPLALGTYLFAVQLYCDFSGYTDMALGVARFFGIGLTQNFNNPYAARSVVEFWRRWHISFSRWIFDYIFKPLQFALRDLRTAGVAVALTVTFLMSGIWHGVGWTFFVWGMMHGVYMSVSISTRSVRNRWHDRLFRGRPALGRAWQVFATSHLVLFSWIFFRAQSLTDAWYVVMHTATRSSGGRALLFHVGVYNLLVVAIGAGVVGWIDMTGRAHRVERILEQPAWFRWPAYYALAIAILVFRAEAQRTFIYFQF
jgi:D-alanyl-lipoteichoic acid acyltransferase DltB (MBOAT superfamily)